MPGPETRAVFRMALPYMRGAVIWKPMPTWPRDIDRARHAPAKDG
jgi:hypothetical protein